ncbi:MAG: hypothetical protein SFY32_13075 [Bacteroidota bacterium]|nr:hypothetical protein [Bacteroidota bacterium]
MSRPILTHLSWEQLLDELSDSLLQDEKRLENNIEYYKKQLNSSNPDKTQLERIYQRIISDSNRNAFTKEVLARLQTFPILAIIQNLNAAIAEEAPKKGGTLHAWSFTIHFENEQVKTYFNTK